MKGSGPKSLVCPSNPRKTKLFWRDTPGCCGDIPGVPEKFEKNNLCSILGHYWSPPPPVYQEALKVDIVNRDI